MDREHVRSVVNQLVESFYDQHQAMTRLRNFQDASDPPQAPSEFESLEAFLDFHDRRQDYENQLGSLKTEHTNATEEYEQAELELSEVLPRHVPLHYTYKGDREELKDQQYDIIKLGPTGRSRFKIMSRPTQP